MNKIRQNLQIELRVDNRGNENVTHKLKYSKQHKVNIVW